MGQLKLDGIEIINLFNKDGEQTLNLTGDQGLVVSGKITFPDNKAAEWPNGSIRAEGNTLKLVATTLIDLQDDTQIQGNLHVNTTSNASSAPLHVGNTNGGSWNDGIVIDDASGWAATVYKRSNNPKMFTGLYTGTDNFIFMSTGYSNTSTGVTAPRTDAVLRMLPGSDIVEHYLPNYFGREMTIQVNNSGNPDTLTLYNINNGQGAGIRFSDQGNSAQKGYLHFYHADNTNSQAGGALFQFSSTEDDLVLSVGTADATHGRITVWGGANNTKPDYAFGQDLNTGMLRTAADNIRFVTEGAAVLELDDDQNVRVVNKLGISSVNTSYNLYNDGTSYFNGAVTIDSSITQTGTTADSVIASFHHGAFDSRQVGMPGRFMVGPLGNGYPSIGYNFTTAGDVYTKIANDTAWAIHFGVNNKMSFNYKAAGTGTFTWDERMAIDASGNTTFAGNITTTGDLTASQLTIDDYIYHAGDSDTYIYFTDNKQTFRAAGNDLLMLERLPAANAPSGGGYFYGAYAPQGLVAQNLGGSNMIKKGTDIAVATSQREEVVGPDGSRKVQAHVSTGNGNSSNCYHWYSSENVRVDPEKDYEFSVWIKSTGDDHLYLGWHEYKANGGKISGNPYFHTSKIKTHANNNNSSSVATPNINGWVLLKYQLKSHRTTSGQADTEGTDRYASQGNTYQHSGSTGVMHSTTTHVHLRLGSCYGSVNGSKSYFYNPKITEAQNDDIKHFLKASEVTSFDKISVPQGKKMLLDGRSGHTYITEESDSNLKFYVAAGERLNLTNTNANYSVNLMPVSENNYNIGSASLRWEDLYVDDGYIRNAYIDTKIIHNGDDDNFIEFTDNKISISKDVYLSGDIKTNEQSLDIQVDNDATGGNVALNLNLGTLTPVAVKYDTNDGSYLELRGNLWITGGATTTNQAREIKFTGFDKEGTTDFSDIAKISHTTNTGGHSGSVLLIQSQNDANDGIAFATNGSSNLKHNSNVIWTAGNDGASSGLDADLLDGNHASAFSLSSHNHDDRYTLLDHIRSLGAQAFTGGSSSSITTAQLISEMESDGAFDSYSSVFKTSWSYAGNDNLSDAGRFTETAGTSFLTWTDNSSDTARGNITVLAVCPNTGGSANKVFIYNDQGSSYSPGWREIWTNASDGAGSGLDADLLDGQQGSYYAAANQTISIGSAGDLNAASWAANTSLGGLYLKTQDSITAGEYTNADVTVNSKGIITSISNGSSGTSITYSASGNRYGVTPFIGTDGVMEVGRYIDFHTSDGSTSNYAHRIYVTGSTLYFSAGIAGTSASFSSTVDMNSNARFNYLSGSRGSLFETASDAVQTFRCDSDRYRVWMNGSERLTVTNTGRIGINDSTPDYTLDVSGNVSGISIYASHDIAAYSDKRVKKDIETIEDALQKVKKLRGVTFKRKDGLSDKVHMGVIAQEVQKVIPEVVSAKESDGHLSVSYGNMVGVLIEAVKELSAEIEELKSNKCKCKD